MLKKISAEPEQNQTTWNQKLYGLRRALKRNTTECQFLVLYYLRLEKHALTFSSENVIFQQSKTSSSIPLDKKIYWIFQVLNIPNKSAELTKSSQI